ncbi:MAG TPA: adenosine-specific kinase [Candidatus Eisenbacteria bacterium]|nr:adenosine-specific kinase [Candidatus Eisenbacteria bacterium]
MTQLPLEIVPIETPTGANLILGQAHFIKTAEDLYETVVNSVPSAKFGVAFSEASGPRLIRSEGNDPALQTAAEQQLLKLSCGHAFLVFLQDSFPINLLRDIRACVEVVTVFCATANPVSVVVLRQDDASAILGVLDGQNPLGIEDEEQTRARREFVRRIGYKR